MSSATGLHGQEEATVDPEATLLRIDDLRIVFPSPSGPVRAVNGISLVIRPGEALGLVGETGAGKSLTAWAAMGLLPAGAHQTSGTITYRGTPLTPGSKSALSGLRGCEIAMVVQNPLAALNPTATVGSQIVKALRAHNDCSRTDARRRALESLQEVGIADPERRFKAYPHQLSIGMAQRVVIAIALLHSPRLLIADEPTSGLDVTIQARILDLIAKLVSERQTALWLITHDLGVVANYCDRAAVMFAGEVVESAAVSDLIEHPAHPYTRGVLDAALSHESGRERVKVVGLPPDLTVLPAGCSFAYRCPWAEDKCRQSKPTLVELRSGHQVRCWVAQRRETQ